MGTQSTSRTRACRGDGPQPADGLPHRLVRRWIVTNALVAGLCALLWLLLRSGTKPSRFAYPCQQAAFSTAALALGGPLVATLLAARRRIIAGLQTPTGLVCAALGLFAAGGLWGYVARAAPYEGPRLDPPRGYRARVYHVSECPQDPVGDRFIGLDNLFALMGREGLKFYRSENPSLVAGPEGIIAAEDVVVIKINYQWPDRGGTNTDVLRGLILRILNHPDTFTGEVVVCENAQFNSVNNFDRSQNNAQDHGQSPHDVVMDFQNQGYTISHFDWTVLRYTQVNEYSEGDTADGYVVYPYDSQLHGRISYPKFSTEYGTQISLRDGLWQPLGGQYDRERLKLINAPVLKSHHATYGATACVKNYMGVVTRELSTNSHGAIRYGILGALLGEIHPADLNLLDCVWINANPNDGPWTSYSAATRRDMLIASTDPVAADIWAVKNVLIPAFLENGYSPPWPNPDANPDDPDSDFREYLDNSMNWILAAGYEATNDPLLIDLTSWDGAGDMDVDSDVDGDDFLLAGGCLLGPALPADPGCESCDFDTDGDVDLADMAGFQRVFTGPGVF